MAGNDSGGRDKNRKLHSAAFYIEALVLAVVFVIVILVLTKVFALSRQMSAGARLLTCAVHLAENTAEAVSASDSPQALYELLDEDGNAQIYQKTLTQDFPFPDYVYPDSEWECSKVLAWYDDEMNPAPEGGFLVDITWLPEEENGAGSGSNVGLARCLIAVYWNGEPVYTLETAVYRRQGL